MSIFSCKICFNLIKFVIAQDAIYHKLDLIITLSHLSPDHNFVLKIFLFFLFIYLTNSLCALNKTCPRWPKRILTKTPRPTNVLLLDWLTFRFPTTTRPRALRESPLLPPDLLELPLLWKSLALTRVTIWRPNFWFRLLLRLLLLLWILLLFRLKILLLRFPRPPTMPHCPLPKMVMSLLLCRRQWTNLCLPSHARGFFRI